jgi:hypothetical protein
VGGVLVAGLQLANIGQLPPTSWRLYVALASAAVALLAVALMVTEASAVLTHESLTLADFADEGLEELLGKPKRSQSRINEIGKIHYKIEQSRHELFGYAAETLGQLHRLMREADEQNGRVRRAGSSVHRSALARRAARDVVQYANYQATLELFKKMRRNLAWSAAIVAISSGIFAYAANPPKNDDPVRVQIVSGK